MRVEDSQKVRFADCEFDPQRFELRRAGVLVEASPKTLDLIAFFIERREQLVTRDELFDELWPGTAVNEGSLSNAIYEVRTAVGDDAQRQQIIQTVRGRGFRFIADVDVGDVTLEGGSGADGTPASLASQAFSSRWSIVLNVLVLGLGPNAVLGYVNWLYNSTQSIPESMRADFDLLVALYNPITFFVGGVWLLLLARKPIRAMQAVQGGGALPSLAARQRALVLGHASALVSIALWVAAGVLYPSALQLMTGEVRAEGALHFLGSLVLCGLAAAAYPFFLITRFSIRSIYPALGGRPEDRRADRATILRLRDLAGAYLLAACGIPLFSVVLVALVGSGERWLLVLVSVVGLVGLGVAFVMYRRLQDELDQLAPRES